MDGSFAYLALAAAVMNVSVVTGLRPLIMPRTSDHFEVASVDAARMGNTAELRVSRQIHSPIVMEYTVRIMAEAKDGLRLFCSAHGGPFEYHPRAVMPDPVTLDWWTDGQCKAIPDGAVQIITTWTPADPALKPVTVIARVE